MPFTLSTLIGRAHPFHSRPPTSSKSQRKLYFPPGGHTHDRHTIPPDRVHISLSDPVLVAAERRLFDVPNTQKRSNWLIIEDAGARKTAKAGSIVFHLEQGGLPSQLSADCHLVPEAVNPLATILNIQGTTQGHCWKTGCQGAAGNTDSSASENRSGLAPLASETFKEELYTRGYLKRPTSRPSNVVPRKSKTSLMFVSRKVFPKVLRRRQGRKVVECLRAGQVTSLADTPGGLDVQFAEKQPSTSVASVTLRTPHAHGLESPGLDTNSSASESFDLHEFSYITAFTTPPSSPSIIIDAETFKRGVDSKHAV
ncbi:hypothetical protein J3R82DRAFT_2555 [Butyriboletus roseoflavus]|nr:hypothetical protein J3R82DRAFT_2555 [Butyriboletus roseoflavus]